MQVVLASLLSAATLGSLPGNEGQSPELRRLVEAALADGYVPVDEGVADWCHAGKPVARHPFVNVSPAAAAARVSRDVTAALPALEPAQKVTVVAMWHRTCPRLALAVTLVEVRYADPDVARRAWHDLAAIERAAGLTAKPHRFWREGEDVFFILGEARQWTWKLDAFIGHFDTVRDRIGLEKVEPEDHPSPRLQEIVAGVGTLGWVPLQRCRPFEPSDVPFTKVPASWTDLTALEVRGGKDGARYPGDFVPNLGVRKNATRVYLANRDCSKRWGFGLVDIEYESERVAQQAIETLAADQDRDDNRFKFAHEYWVEGAHLYGAITGAFSNWPELDAALKAAGVKGAPPGFPQQSLAGRWPWSPPTSDR
jgi:hypothetical protein